MDKLLRDWYERLSEGQCILDTNMIMPGGRMLVGWNNGTITDAHIEDFEGTKRAMKENELLMDAVARAGGFFCTPGVYHELELGVRYLKNSLRHFRTKGKEVDVRTKWSRTYSVSDRFMRNRYEKFKIELCTNALRKMQKMKRKWRSKQIIIDVPSGEFEFVRHLSGYFRLQERDRRNYQNEVSRIHEIPSDIETVLTVFAPGASLRHLATRDPHMRKVFDLCAIVFGHPESHFYDRERTKGVYMHLLSLGERPRYFTIPAHAHGRAIRSSFSDRPDVVQFINRRYRQFSVTAAP